MKSILAYDRLQLWGGIECTVNRVRDTYHDQLIDNGHARREEDLDLIADLHLDALRYPVLWERTAPDGPEKADWGWTDRRLGRLRERGLAPIAGLVHHGSGPPHTHLLDEGFADGLERYAAAVAQRYPWIEAYTPVNEPLTTARFSGLYGHWYPHERSAKAFATALLNQCHGTAQAMRAIRRVNPGAKLVLTEDLAKTHSTPRLAEQAAFENERRWLSIDLLLGRVTRGHPLWNYLACSPRLVDRLLQLADNPYPPDVLGFNYYLTSERLLDERLERYAAWSHGGNGQMRYADIEAVRARCEGIDGPERLLREAWQRYGLPLAITEVHLGGHREEQVRWLLDSWALAHELRSAGIDLRAIAVWSLLGSYDWNSLCTCKNGCYEPGAFDVRGSKPRPTAIARVAKQLATQAPVDTTVIPHVGWWRTDLRLCYPPVDTGAALEPEPLFRLQAAEKQRPLLLLGSDSALGRGFVRACKMRRLACVDCLGDQLDLTEPDAIEDAIEKYRPWAVVHASLDNCLDDALNQAKECHEAVCIAAKNVATECADFDLPLLTFTSEHVFDGALGPRYVESDATNPQCDYGRMQCEIEQIVGQLHRRSLVIRCGALFAPCDEHNFILKTLRGLADAQPVWAADDGKIAPTYVPDLVHACLDLLLDGETGLWHLANRDELSWVELAQRAAKAAGLPSEHIFGGSDARLGPPLATPRSSILASERGQLLPPLADAVRRYCDEAVERWRPSKTIAPSMTPEEASDVACSN